jgi:hypothetical protein
MTTSRTALIGLTAVALLVGGCSSPTPKTTPVPTPSASVADPARDLGAGTPGAYCATSRLGKHFTKDGVTYTCKGPKPYRWRS